MQPARRPQSRTSLSTLVGRVLCAIVLGLFGLLLVLHPWVGLALGALVLLVGFAVRAGMQIVGPPKPLSPRMRKIMVVVMSLNILRSCAELKQPAKSHRTPFRGESRGDAVIRHP